MTKPRKTAAERRAEQRAEDRRQRDAEIAARIDAIIAEFENDVRKLAAALIEMRRALWHLANGVGFASRGAPFIDPSATSARNFCCDAQRRSCTTAC